MGNKVTQYDGGTSMDDGRGGHEGSQALDPTLIRSFTELANTGEGDTTELNMEKFQIVRILSNMRQYRLLSGLYDRAVRTAGEEKFFWHQLSLALMCDQRFPRATKVLHNSIAQSEADPEKVDENSLSEYMQMARMQIEQLGDLDLAESMALKAVNLSSGTWLSGRCYLLLAMISGLKAQYNTCLEAKKHLVAESIRHFERAIELDPHDDLAHLYCALEYANCRNLEMARERCQTALDLNIECPFAIMLMALIFTARKDYKGALALVINSLADFPSHYGLLVLRLKLEAKYGRVTEALQTSRNLIYFWRKTRLTEFVTSETENLANGGEAGGKTAVDNLLQTSGSRQLLGSKEAIVPMTPLLTAPLGIATTPAAHLSAIGAANMEATPYASNDNVSTVGPLATASDMGGPASSDSTSIITSSSKSWISYSAFRLQADIWVELAEFFIEMERLQDVQACVEEACMIYPNSHQALYLKGHLYLVRSEKCQQTDPSLCKRLRAEAKNCILGAISICTGHVPSHACLGQLYQAEGNLKMAEKMFRDSLAIDSFNFRNWHRLGCILAELERNDEALECFQMAAALENNTPLIPFQVIPRLLAPIPI